MTTVKVHYNKPKKMWAVKEADKPTYYLDSLVLANCKWVVQPGGNRRARETGQRNVHAYVKGNIVKISRDMHLIDSDPLLEHYYLSPISYNPFVHGSFVDNTGAEILNSDYAVFMKYGGSHAAKPFYP